MENHDRLVRKLGNPTFKILLHVLIKMASVHVEQVDAAILNMIKSLGEGHLQQRAERFVGRVHVLDRFINVVVESGMLIALPSIDSNHASFETCGGNGLAHCKI